MAVAISNAVGDPKVDGTASENRYDDVLVVQRLLNKFAPAEGGPDAPLALDGSAPALSFTRKAIRKFQQQRLGFEDGRVDPGQKTLAELNTADLAEFEGITDVDERRSVILRPHPELNFTRGRMATLKAGGGSLTFSAQTQAWLPAAVQNNISATFERILAPGTPAFTWGVGPFDAYHAHLCLPRSFEGDPAQLAIAAQDRELVAAIDALRLAVGSPEGRINAAHLAEYQAKYPPLLLDGRAKALAAAVVATGVGSLNYHTFERPDFAPCPPQAVRPAGMLPTDPRRNWLAPLDTNVPAQTPFVTPLLQRVNLFQLVLLLEFLVDVAGVVSVVAGVKIELTTVAGQPEEEIV
jgi:hypothetical protein